MKESNSVKKFQMLVKLAFLVFPASFYLLCQSLILRKCKWNLVHDLRFYREIRVTMTIIKLKKTRNLFIP